MGEAKFVDIVFDGPPGPTSPGFIEVENAQGKSISFGEWVERDDGYWVLRIEGPAQDRAAIDRLIEAARGAKTALYHLLPNGDDIEDEHRDEMEACWKAHDRLRLALGRVDL